MNTVNKYTFNGNSVAEQMVSVMINTISECISNCIPENDLKALVLLGGYGKGEGGITNKDGLFKPHNNFDLLLVTPSRRKFNSINISNKISEKVRSLSQILGIGIDISVISEGKLRAMPTRVLWYDMKEGHKTIHGDKELIPSLNHISKNIPAWDMRNLMVNRGSLLLINRLCLQHRNLTSDIKKIIIKHTMKAIIGYGDALIFSLGEYHWSYSEKKKRILINDQVSFQFKRLYQEAINFRFNPSYGHYLQIDLQKWQDETCLLLKKVHLQCESVRLDSPNLTWGNYLETSLSHLINDVIENPKSLIKGLLNICKTQKTMPPKGFNRLSKLGCLTSNHETILPLLHPLITFDLSEVIHKGQYNNFIASYLNIKYEKKSDFICPYLKLWGDHFDPNFRSVLEKNNIKLS